MDVSAALPCVDGHVRVNRLSQMLERNLFLAARCGTGDELVNGVARSAKNEPGGRDRQPCKQIHKFPIRLLLCKFAKP